MGLVVCPDGVVAVTHAEVEYVGLALGSFVSWLGLPGPGEPLLIAAGILAARNRLALEDVLVIAFAGAITGGIAGLVGREGGGPPGLERPGPLYGMRMRALARGEEVFGAGLRRRCS